MPRRGSVDAPVGAPVEQDAEPGKRRAHGVDAGLLEAPGRVEVVEGDGKVSDPGLRNWGRTLGTL